MVRKWASTQEAADYLRALGYTVVGTLAQADLCVSERLDEETAAFGREGGSVLVLADGPDAVGTFFPRVDIFSPQMRPHTREGTPWSGYWVTSFSWLRRAGPFARIPGDLFLDQSFERVIPAYVLEGFSPSEFEERVYAGIFVGWVNKMAALIGERRYGRGRVVLTTFRLFNDPPGADPIATSLLDGLVALALNRTYGLA